jgi:hypothetical protein
MQAQGHDKRDTLHVQVPWLRNTLMAPDIALKASSNHCAAEYQNGSFDASSRRADAMLLSTQGSGKCSRCPVNHTNRICLPHYETNISWILISQLGGNTGELHKIKAFHYTPCGYKQSEYNGFFSLLL